MGQPIIVLCRTKNLKKIRKILFHEDICRHLVIDREHIEKNLHIFRKKEAINYIFEQDGQIIGLAVILRYPKIGYAQGDIGFIKKSRGKIAKKCAILTLNNYYKHYDDELLVKIKRNNKRSMYFCQMIGFKLFRKDNEFYYMRYQRDGRNS